MKINMAANTTSPVENQRMVGNLIKEFCASYNIPFNTAIYSHLLHKGSDQLAVWAAEVKKLPFQHVVIKDESQTYGIIFDFEENKHLTELLLKG
jgi:urate oxidase